MVSSRSALAIRSLKAISGAAANGTAAADSILKARSGMRLSAETGLRLEIGEELRHFLPDLSSSRQSAPVAANQADQLEAFVDGNDVIFRVRKAPGVAEAVDEQRFDVRLHFAEGRIFRGDVFPRIEG